MIAASSFEFLAPPHVTAIALTVILSVGLAIIARKTSRPSIVRAMCLAIGSILVINELIAYGHDIYMKGWGNFVQHSLPLHLCGLAVFLTALAVVKRNQFAYETAYFWGIAGTLQAIITPDLDAGYPSYRYVQYFVTHGLIVIGVLFATWGLRMRPSLRSMFRTFILTDILAIGVGIANWLLDANYMFLCAPPKGESPFFFVDWPWYLLALQPIALAIFALLYLPFPLADRLKRQRKTPS